MIHLEDMRCHLEKIQTLGHGGAFGIVWDLTFVLLSTSDLLSIYQQTFLRNIAEQSEERETPVS